MKPHVSIGFSLSLSFSVSLPLSLSLSLSSALNSLRWELKKLSTYLCSIAEQFLILFVVLLIEFVNQLPIKYTTDDNSFCCDQDHKQRVF